MFKCLRLSRYFSLVVGAHLLWVQSPLLLLVLLLLLLMYLFAADAIHESTARQSLDMEQVHDGFYTPLFWRAGQRVPARPLAVQPLSHVHFFLFCPLFRPLHITGGP